jgi:rhodanese-related sulfurtransferase
MKNLYKSLLGVSFLFLIFNSCLEDISEPLLLKFDNSSDLITYVETRTNILKGIDQPVLVDADELSGNLDNYLVLDIRTQADFESGHVPGAVSVRRAELLQYMGSINPYEYDKIVIVSNTGQIASYVTCLLKIAGYNNVYPLDRGMTFWNSVFSDELRNAWGKGSHYNVYANMPAVKPSKSAQTPKVSYPDDVTTIIEKVNNRINSLLALDEFALFISKQEFGDAYAPTKQLYDGLYVVYVMPDSALHIGSPPRNGIRIVFGPRSMIYYDTPWDFLVAEDLLTFPIDKNIVLYSPNGQRASFYQAYLNFIGHETARSIKYGAMTLMDWKFINVTYIPSISPLYEYKDTIYTPTYLTPYGFWEDDIRNYSIESGP